MGNGSVTFPFFPTVSCACSGKTIFLSQLKGVRLTLVGSPNGNRFPTGRHTLPRICLIEEFRAGAPRDWSTVLVQVQYSTQEEQGIQVRGEGINAAKALGKTAGGQAATGSPVCNWASASDLALRKRTDICRHVPFSVTLLFQLCRPH